MPLARLGDEYVGPYRRFFSFRMANDLNKTEPVDGLILFYDTHTSWVTTTTIRIYTTPLHCKFAHCPSYLNGAISRNKLDTIK